MSTCKSFQRLQIALALRAHAILITFEKIYLCLFIPNCTRIHVITDFTNCNVSVNTMIHNLDIITTYSRKFHLLFGTHKKTKKKQSEPQGNVENLVPKPDPKTKSNRSVTYKWCSCNLEKKNQNAKDKRKVMEMESSLPWIQQTQVCQGNA